MSSRASKEREILRESGSLLAGHSLSAKNIRDQRAGEVRVFGRAKAEILGIDRRNQLRRERAQALYDGINNIFQGQFSEEDILSVIVFVEEFERVDSEVPNAATIDFNGLRPSDESFGEPQFFRRK